MKTRIKESSCFTVIIVLCSVVVSLFVATSCNEIENPGEDELYIYAKVENASKYSNVVAVKLMMRDNVVSEDVEIAQGDWKDGSFTIVLPKIDRKDYRKFFNIRVLPITISENLSTISISNKNAGRGFVEFVGVDKDDNVVTRFHPTKMDENGNAARVSFGYVDSDVSIFGYIRAGTWATDFDEFTGLTSNWAWQNHTIYSIEYKEGWNVSSYSSVQSQKRLITDKYSTIPINSSLKWYGGEDGGN